VFCLALDYYILVFESILHVLVMGVLKNALILFYWVMNLFSFGYEHQGLAMAPHNIAN
jgi:hypothetical protein